MKTEQYICLNGAKFKASAPLLNISNRAFRYGDALFETIRCIHQIPMFFESHYQRLLNGMSLLKMHSQSLPPMEILRAQISSLITKNRLFGDVRIRLSVFREDGGLYTPTSNKVNYTIETSALESQKYTLNNKGLIIGLYNEDKKAFSRFNQFKTANALLFVLAGRYKQEHQLDDVLIFNQNNQVIEGLASNLYWIKDGVIYTPRRSSGCVDGVMRKQLLAIFTKQAYQFEETEGAEAEELITADEIFLSNAIQGIQWVVGLGTKRYYCRLTKQLNLHLNEYATNYLMDFQES